MVITIAEEKNLIKEIEIKSLPKNWQTIDGYKVLQELGSKWYQSKESLILKVPSAIIHQESNYVINTTHPLYTSNIAIKDREDYFWDERLL